MSHDRNYNTIQTPTICRDGQGQHDRQSHTSPSEQQQPTSAPHLVAALFALRYANLGGSLCPPASDPPALPQRDASSPPSTIIIEAPFKLVANPPPLPLLPPALTTVGVIFPDWIPFSDPGAGQGGGGRRQGEHGRRTIAELTNTVGLGQPAVLTLLYRVRAVLCHVLALLCRVLVLLCHVLALLCRVPFMLLSWLLFRRPISIGPTGVLQPNNLSGYLENVVEYVVAQAVIESNSPSPTTPATATDASMRSTRKPKHSKPKQSKPKQTKANQSVLLNTVLTYHPGEAWPSGPVFARHPSCMPRPSSISTTTTINNSTTGADTIVGRGRERGTRTLGRQGNIPGKRTYQETK